MSPADYSFPNFSATSLDGQAETELKFTATLLTYARHAMNGRVHWSRITAWVVYKENYDATDVLTRVADASNVASAMDSLNPQQPQYKALKAKLAELRAQKADSLAGADPLWSVLEVRQQQTDRQVQERQGQRQEQDRKR